MISPLVEIMARLRDPETGCPWDVQQDFGTIAPYTIEEAHEVADAIARGDMADLKDELGDLLLQVVFHSRMAEEAGHFTIGDVVQTICDKMIRRHPHVFGNSDADTGLAVRGNWEAIKAAERDQKEDKSAMAHVALGLPALMRAEKLQRRAARTGFDWPDPSGARVKIDEELAEIEAEQTPDALEDEFGDLLFACVNWARHLGVDPEAALRRANRKFEARFRAMEGFAGDAFAALSLDDKEELWSRAKRELTRPVDGA